MLNPGDGGLLGDLARRDAAAASRRAVPGRTTVAGHVAHVCYGLDLLDRWAAGEPNPWADADWDGSWRPSAVDPAAWDALRARLAAASRTWRAHVAGRAAFDDLAAAGAISSLAHTMYHLGAVRQVVAATG